MSKKTLIMIFMSIGMTAGAFVPLLWGGSALGGWSILLGLVGGIVGIWAGVKVGNQLG